jgi:hypothetical protein
MKKKGQRRKSKEARLLGFHLPRDEQARKSVASPMNAKNPNYQKVT